MKMQEWFVNPARVERPAPRAAFYRAAARIL
jgi:hypothetical protein